MTATAQRNLPSGDVLLRAIAVIEVAAYPHAEWEAHMTANGAIAVSAFHSQFLPATRVYRYARHIALHTGYDEAGLAAGIALLARYAVSTGRGVTPLVLHRLLATCIQVGMKASSDRFVKNIYMAPIAGMSLPELNYLEEWLLDAIDFRAIPTTRELVDLPIALAALGPDTTLDTVNAMLARFASVPPPAPRAASACHGADAPWCGTPEVSPEVNPAPADPSHLVSPMHVAAYGHAEAPDAEPPLVSVVHHAAVPPPEDDTVAAARDREVTDAYGDSATPSPGAVSHCSITNLSVTFNAADFAAHGTESRATTSQGAAGTGSPWSRLSATTAPVATA